MTDDRKPEPWPTCSTCLYFLTHTSQVIRTDPETGEETTSSSTEHLCRRRPSYVHHAPTDWCGGYNPRLASQKQGGCSLPLALPTT
jgi:hypothetical protein